MQYRRIIAALVALCIVTAGCGGGMLRSTQVDATRHTVTEPVYIDKAFTTFERAEIERALKDWNWTLNGYYQFRIEDENWDPKNEGPRERAGETGQGVLIYRATLEETVIMEMLGELHGGTLGWTEPGLIDVHIVADRIGTRNLHMVVMHELGHTLGMGHWNIPDTLMASPGELDCDCVDQYTAMQLANGWHWDWRFLRPCDRPRR